jgi:CheY-like chemotaxis protein
MILREIAADAADAGSSPPAVLVVDDDPTGRMLAGAALKDQMNVVEAENGLVAVEALERQKFDIAILDLDMPVMNGFGVIERARSRPETRHLPIIVVTGREDVVSIERAFALGATSFLCKPINWSVFRHQVGYVLKVARVERRLRAANERLERLAALRARCIAALGREVESLVGAVEGVPGGSSVALQKANAAGERLSRLSARITRASDILTGATEVSPQVASAYDLAAAAVRAIGAAEGPEKAERVETYAAERLEVLCDPDLVREALVEILKNALAASRSHEKVQLRIVDQPPDRVRFEIQDRGPGIPEYLLESGIEDLTPVDPASGMQARPGLGLVLAKAIVDRHGGHFGIMSEPGRGTEAFLSFPSAAGRTQGQSVVNRAAQIAS